MDLKEQYFGTEIEMTGITREEAANAVGELFGTQPYYIGTYYSTWGVRDLEGKEWKFIVVQLSRQKSKLFIMN